MRGHRLDVAVGALLAALAGWTALAAVGRPHASALPVVGMVAAAATALVVGRVGGTRLPGVLPLLVAVAVLGALLANPDAWRGGATAGPLGYANADAALAVQGVASGCLALVTVRGRRRLPLAVLVMVLAIATVVLHSTAADVLLLPVLAVTAWAVLRPPHATAWLAVVVGVVVAACVTVTALLGATYHASHPTSVARVAERGLTATRVALWHDAVRLVADHPLRGVGPRRFPLVSPVARRDPDTRQAHSDFLQTGAEEGIPGLVLLAATFGCLLARLGTRGRSARASVGAAGIAAVAVHASVDYVLQFPAVVIVAALVAGAATATAREVSPGSPG